MLRLIGSQRAQAAVEIAIISSIIILAFASLIDFTERVNRTQDHMQKVFRARLAKAKGASATSTENMYYRAPNITDPYAPGALVYLEDTGKVLWSGEQNPSEISWDVNDENQAAWEKMHYTKKLVHEGQKAYHVVTYYDPIVGGPVTRGEYASP